VRSPPVLLVVFNRPDVAQRLLDAVRAARPARLFIAGDGPRADHPEDARRCAETRRVFEAVDWPCDVRTLYRDTNLGLSPAVISAITWFFDEVESGIILEDDCLPEPSFFQFAAELLDRYADDRQVMHISGLNMRPRERFDPHSYFFASIGHIWGWATWRRAWRLVDPSMSGWPALRRSFGAETPTVHRVLGRKFASAHARRKFTWARLWYYTLVRHGSLSVVPAVNKESNVGFGPDATHTTSDVHPLRFEDAGALTFPLSHPTERTPNGRYDQYLARYHAGSYARRAEDLSWAAIDAMQRMFARRADEGGMG